MGPLTFRGSYPWVCPSKLVDEPDQLVIRLIGRDNDAERMPPAIKGTHCPTPSYDGDDVRAL
jgi:hypothetical protein